MKSFKNWDCGIQVMLISVAVLTPLILKRALGEILFLCYFTVGGWQMISVLAHALAPATYRLPLRKIYLWLLLITVVTTAIVIAVSMNNDSDFIIQWMFGILFWTPVLAIFYLVICIKETQRLRLQQQLTDETPQP